MRPAGLVRRLLGAMLLSLLAGAAAADERILSYHAEVTIQPDGAVTVTEDIRVRAEGRDIRRGIYRDFPTRYRDRLGNHYRVDFRVESASRNGLAEPWHTEDLANGTRVYLGDANRTVPTGEHVYRLRFHTNRQLGYFDSHDELYWNVTGNGWAFPIDRVTARVSLPFVAPAAALRTSVYTGSFGATGSDARSAIVDGRTVEFQTTRPLQPREGLTVAVEWPKGLIAEPSAFQQARWFLRDNGAALALLTGWLLAAAWHLLAWRRVGRDPAKGVIIPRFKPPAELSPAACRYVLEMSFDDNAFSAAMISLAVKGHIRIEEETTRRPLGAQKITFTLHRTTGERQQPPTRGETAVLAALLPRPGDSIEMKNTHHPQFQRARSALNAALKKEHQGKLFHLNTLYLAPPVAISALSALVAAGADGSPAVWISWIILTLVLHGVFFILLRAPTPAGRQVMDEIEGFRMYLDTAEQDRLDQMRSPVLTPEVFEAFLPYAYALGVANHWCERFARELPEEIRHQSAYQPAWYSGRFHGMQALDHLGGSFSSSLSSAISSASTPPGSSSGGGGGGSSGGGGGGGGGGGW